MSSPAGPAGPWYSHPRTCPFLEILVQVSSGARGGRIEWRRIKESLCTALDVIDGSRLQKATGTSRAKLRRWWGRARCGSHRLSPLSGLSIVQSWRQVALVELDELILLRSDLDQDDVVVPGAERLIALR
jgi:hypothetical protein